MDLDDRTTSFYSLRLLVVLMVMFLGAGIAHAGEDMWSSVFAYQQKMANYGNPEAQVKLGEMYEEGHGTPQDFDKAKQWYQKAATQGYAPAKGKLKKLEQRRKQEAQAKQRADQERLAQEKLERERAAEEKALEAEQAKRAKAEKERKSHVTEQKPPSKEQAAKEEGKKGGAEGSAAQAADKAKQQEDARKRAQEAIKKMLSAPSAYSEE